MVPPKANILLVDDQPGNLLVLEAVLQGLGQNLVKANSAAQALKCLLNDEFALILMDAQMPVMDGFEAATLIRRSPSLSARRAATSASCSSPGTTSTAGSSPTW